MPITSPQVALPPRYRVLRHVATGGMASVYAAVDETLGREVAVKVLAEGLAVDESARRRFTREARAAARVSDHPNVVTIYDIAETDEDPPLAFIVMELLTGGTVNDRLRAGEPIPHTLALRWLAQTAAALDAAHAAGMVHRDVKPANLLLDAKGQLKVADFGIATLTNDVPLTQTGQVVGTAAYFSPEQAMGRSATPASDRYALAVVAFELLTGRRPFTESNPAAQAIAHADAEPPAATSVAPGLPDAVDEVLARGLAKDPAQRPATGAVLVAELEGALGPTASTGVAVPVGDPTRVAAPLPATPRPRRRGPAGGAVDVPRFHRSPPPGVAALADPAPRRSRAGLVAAALALLLLAGVAVAALAGGGSGSPATRASTAGTSTRAHHHARRHRTTSTAAAAPSHTPSTAAAPAPTRAGGVPGDARAIQARAHAALLAGDPQGAVALLRGLVGRCPVAVTDPCAYAWFDYGSALRQAGDPQAAIPVLQHRLQNPDQQAAVQHELDLARAQAAGTSTGTSTGTPAPTPAPAPGNGHGKAKGLKKG